MLPPYPKTHIIDILRSKWDRGLQDFHVQLYVCAPEFDFMKTVRFQFAQETASYLYTLAFTEAGILHAE